MSVQYGVAGHFSR